MCIAVPFLSLGGCRSFGETSMRPALILPHELNPSPDSPARCAEVDPPEFACFGPVTIRPQSQGAVKTV